MSAAFYANSHGGVVHNADEYDIDGAWTEEIEADYQAWLAEQPGVPFSHDDIAQLKDIRTW